MEQFKLVNLFKSINSHEYSKLYSLISSCKYIVGDDCINSNESIYIKNYYNYLNRKLEIGKVEIYKVKNNRFYRVYYCEDFKGACVECYPLSEITSICLKERKRHGSSYFDLSVSFKYDKTFNLNNESDTCDNIASDDLAKGILEVYNELN